MGVVVFGAFMVVLDTTVVNLGLPSIREDFGVGEGVEWVITCYLAAVGISQTTSGWLADRFGRRRVFISALIVFTAASLLCAVAVNFAMLIGTRVLQGVGGGLLMPVAMAMIYDLFEPDERGRALGYFGIAIMAAPAVGPVLGGSLVSSLSWRWLFLINIPVGLVAIPIAIRLLRETGFREARPFDRTGLVLSAAGLSLFLVGISLGGLEGWTNSAVIATVALGAITLIWFVVHSLRAKSPLVDLRIFSSPTFSIAMVCLGLMAVAQYARLVYIPLELGSVRDISEFRIGLTMLPSALCVGVGMPLGGRLVDRIGARIPVGIGISLMAFSFVGLWAIDIDTTLPVVGAVLALGGFGAGLAMMSPNIVAMNSLPSRFVSQASGLSNVSRQVSAAIGVAVLSSIFATVKTTETLAPGNPDLLDPFRTVFLVAGVVLVIAVVVAQFLPGKTKALALQDERRQESDSLRDVVVQHAPEMI